MPETRHQVGGYRCVAGTCVCDLSERTEKDRGALVGTSAQSAPLQVRYSATACYAVEAERVRTGPRRQARVAGKGGIETRHGTLNVPRTSGERPHHERRTSPVRSRRLPCGSSCLLKRMRSGSSLNRMGLPLLRSVGRAKSTGGVTNCWTAQSACVRPQFVSQ